MCLMIITILLFGSRGLTTNGSSCSKTGFGYWIRFINKIKRLSFARGEKNNSLHHSWDNLYNHNSVDANSVNPRYCQSLQRHFGSDDRRNSWNSKLVSLFFTAYRWYDSWCYKKKDHSKSTVETIQYGHFKDKETKTAYHSHLLRDICQVLEQQMETEKLPPTKSLFSLPTEKQNVILSHFFTAEYDSDKYRALYTTYRSLLKFERSMIIKSREVYYHLDEIEGSLLDLHFNSNSKTKYTLNDFFLSLGISNKTDLLDFYKIEDTYQKLMGYRLIDNFKIGDEYIVRINNKDVFKSSSYDISNKCKKMLIKKFNDFNKPFNEAWISTNLEVYARLKQYDVTIKNYLEFIRTGEPITGCCIGCLQYFTGSQKSKFEKLLSEFEDEKVSLSKI